jgi:hypothetical protein
MVRLRYLGTPYLIHLTPVRRPTATYYYKGDTRNRHSCFAKYISSEEDCDYLEFYIDGVLKDQISGEVDWANKISAEYLTGTAITIIVVLTRGSHCAECGSRV